jgi:hypothetical protein
MIGVAYLLRRLPNLTLEEFQRHRREIHGPLVAGHATNLGICRYVQDHQIEDPMNEAMRQSRTGGEPYDGVDELWWNYFEEPGEALAKPQAKRALEDLVEDERKFVDFSRSSLNFVVEIPQISPVEKVLATEKSTIIKWVAVSVRDPNLSFEEAQLYWRTNHGTMIRSLAAINRFRRYIQLHTLKHPRIDPLTERLRAMRGKMGEADWVGIMTLWLDRVEYTAALATPESKRGWEAIVKDEWKHVDHPRGCIWVNKEYVFVDKDVASRW